LLHCRWLESEYDRAIKSGFFIDFILKKISESFVRNILISGAFILGEKYIIEGLTKNAADRFVNLVLTIFPILKNTVSSTVNLYLTVGTYLMGLVLILNFYI
jgi:hypothetical protein